MSFLRRAADIAKGAYAPRVMRILSHALSEPVDSAGLLREHG